MAKPSGLKVFNGWRSLDYNEKMELGDMLVYWQTGSPQYALGTPEGGLKLVDYRNFIGFAWSDSDEGKISLNQSYYPYRKIRREGNVSKESPRPLNKLACQHLPLP